MTVEPTWPFLCCRQADGTFCFRDEHKTLIANTFIESWFIAHSSYLNRSASWQSHDFRFSQFDEVKGSFHCSRTASRNPVPVYSSEGTIKGSPVINSGHALTHDTVFVMKTVQTSVKSERFFFFFNQVSSFNPVSLFTSLPQAPHITGFVWTLRGSVPFQFRYDGLPTVFRAGRSC